MTTFKTRYITSKQNAEIATSAAEVFGQDQSSREANTKWGSFNFFNVVNQSSNAITINLDDGTVRKFVLFANASITLDATEGIFFDWLKIVNQSAADVVAAADLTITFGRAIPIAGT